MSKTLKLIIATVALASIGFLAGCQQGGNSGAGAATASADSSIGVIDMMKVMQEAPVVKAMQAKIEAAAGSQKSEMQTLYQNVQKAQTEADKATGDAKKAADEKLKTANEKFQRVLKALQVKQQADAKQIEDKVQAAISEVAKAKGLSLVLIKQVAPYTHATDVTEDVIKDLGAAKK